MHELSDIPSKAQPKQLEIESLKVVVKEKDQGLESTVANAYQVIQAMKRRGLAMDFAGVVAFRAREKYMQTLFAA